MSHRLLTDEQEKYVSQQYTIGRNMQSLATEFNTNKTTIKNILRRNRIIARPKKRISSLNHDVFDIPCEERSYWIGFLLADGCVLDASNRLPAVQLSLSVKDANHINKFANFCHLSIPVTPSKISFSSEKIVKQLATWNIIPRKSGREIIPNEFATNRDFWRGVIDGDGWISKPYTIGVSGSFKVCLSFCELALNICGSKISPLKIKNKECWQTVIHGPKALTMMRFLYEGSTISLERKQTKVDQLLGLNA